MIFPKVYSRNMKDSVVSFILKTCVYLKRRKKPQSQQIDQYMKGVRIIFFFSLAVEKEKGLREKKPFSLFFGAGDGGAKRERKKTTRLS